MLIFLPCINFSQEPILLFSNKILKSVKSGSFSIQSLSFNSSLYPSIFTFDVALFIQLAGYSFLCRRETGRPEEGKRKRAGDGGKGKERKLFFDYCYFYWDT